MLLPVVACAILFVTYLVIAIGRAPFLRVDRTGAAIVGATLMIATGVIDLDRAYAAIDFASLPSSAGSSPVHAAPQAVLAGTAR